MNNNKEKFYETLSFLLEEPMYDYQKEIWSLVLDYWDEDVYFVFDKKGRSVGRTTIATAMYWLLVEKGENVLFMSNYLIDNNIPKEDVISSASNLDRYRGKKADVIIFDECCVEDIDKALSIFNAKGIIFNNNEKGVIFNNNEAVSLEDIAFNFIGLLDGIGDSVDGIIEDNERELPDYIVSVSKQWSNLSKANKLSVATAFANQAQANFMCGNHVYKNFNIKDRRDV